MFTVLHNIITLPFHKFLNCHIHYHKGDHSLYGAMYNASNN